MEILTAGEIMAKSTTLHIDRYFTTLNYLCRRFDVVARQTGFRARTLEEWEIWRRQLKAKLSELTGLTTMIPCPLNPKVTENIELEGYRRERVEIQTEPDVVLPFYVLLPLDLHPEETRPAVIAGHGHSGGGKFAIAGRRDILAVTERINEANYDYGVQMVREGFVVFCPDARGFGERREKSKQGDDEFRFLRGSCEILNHMAIPLGQTVTGMWVWDWMRLIDYILTRPECRGRKIGCAGLSGGGLQTLWTAALDERVACAVTSGYFYGVKDSLLKMPDNCSCNYVPHLWEVADMGDIGAMIAPRPFLIETGTQDGLNGERGIANAVEQVNIAREAYRLLGAEDRIYHDIFEGKHAWHGCKAIPWLKRWLEL